MTTDDDLIRLWDAGEHSASEIARMFTAAGVPTTKNGILGRVFRLRKAGRIAKPVRAGPVRQPAPPPVPRRPIDQIGPHGCRWIHGDAKGFQTKWCDKPIERPGESWCAEHRSICLRPYVPPPKKTDGLAMVAMADLGKARRAA